MLARCIHIIRCVSIKTRLKLTFLIISILPLLLTSVYFYETYSDKSLKNVVQSTNEVLGQTEKITNAVLNNYLYFCGKMGMDVRIQEALKRTVPLSEKEKENLSKYMDSFLATGVTYPAYVKTIKIVNLEGNFVYDMGYDDIPRAEYTKIFKETKNTTRNTSWFYLKTFMHRDTILLCRQIHNLYNINEPVGYCVLFINEKLFTKEIFVNDLSEGASFTIMKSNGNVLDSTSNSWEKEKIFYESELVNRIVVASDDKDNIFFKYEIDKEPVIVNSIFNEILNGYLVSIIPLSSIQKKVKELLPTIIFFIFVIVIICLALGTLVYHSIMIPIKNAQNVCYEIKKANLQSRVQIDSNDELANLSADINGMLDKYENLININQEREEKKRLLELKVLQYQINPHFLFNTLSTVKWIADINQIPSLVDIITSLSEILKQTLVKKDYYIMLGSEIELLKHYIHIQEYRYINKFKVEFKIEKELEKTKIPRFILQPLVENAIYHGTYENGKMINIIISVKLNENSIVITVCDDGKGFEIDKRKTNSSIGIENVRERIKQTYGPNGTFSISSQLDKGTTCVICIPYKMEYEVM